jgi:aryl-alcohol dehydrogenase-like predicted oxidoreductase
MKTRMLGEIEVSSIGMGCMGFSHAHGDPAPRSECIRMMRRAHELGVTLYDTADVYGDGHNEILVGEALKPIRDQVIILTKYNPERNPVSDQTKGSVEKQIEERLDASLKRLDTDYIDIYMMHRVTDDVPVSMVGEAMAKFKAKGKIRSWAMSRANEQQIREGHAVLPLSVIQNEFSMMVRTPLEDNVLDTCKELGIGFTPYMPLASGFLSGAYKPGMTYKHDDIKRVFSWFTDENLVKNQPILNMLDKFAKAKDATYAQIALAWLMHKYDRLVPIPGMYEERFIDENLRTADIVLTDEDMVEIDDILNHTQIYGDGQEWRVDQLREMVKEEGYEIG